VWDVVGNKPVHLLIVTADEQPLLRHRLHAEQPAGERPQVAAAGPCEVGAVQAARASVAGIVKPGGRVCDEDELGAADAGLVVRCSNGGRGRLLVIRASRQGRGGEGRACWCGRSNQRSPESPCARARIAAKTPRAIQSRVRR
jgi:hypothetical protein